MRHAMGCWTTGVAVIATADRNGRPHGMTVNSLTSVSLDPPLLLACFTHGACRSAEEALPAMPKADQQAPGGMSGCPELGWDEVLCGHCTHGLLLAGRTGLVVPQRAGHK
jgi:Flavin reductase like domain